MQRRDFLIALAAVSGAPTWAFAAREGTRRSVTLAASWQAGASYQVGVLAQNAAGGLRIAAAVDVPTRAHGLLRESGGTLLAVARRPGDWLLRWHRDGRALAWRWIEPRRAFSGHVLASDDGRTLYTTEADLDTGAGLIGVRDAATLEKRAEWPTQGIDAHELIRDATQEGRLMVANGGVPTRPETGRAKRNLERMDSSLVCMDAGTGAPIGQWRLNDRRLSLRHLAWGRGATGPILGVALQAEHDDHEARSSAPVLALFDGRSLRTVAAPKSLAGYGGDIAALGTDIAVSCPRAQGVALHGADGVLRELIPLDEACALATTTAGIWAGGRHAAVTWSASRHVSGSAHGALASHAVPDLRLDNHWIVI
jgi:uncharacterized protein